MLSESYHVILNQFRNIAGWFWSISCMIWKRGCLFQSDIWNFCGMQIIKIKTKSMDIKYCYLGWDKIYGFANT